jgi:mannose-6-phosphate isomerase-like protein (cupin superfamily)
MTTQLNQSRAPILLQAGEGQQVKLKNVTVTYKALGTDTDNTWGLLEYTAPPHFAGPPRHWHATEEAFYVLEGVVTFCLGERTVRAPAGAFVLVPPGALHTFANQEDQPARFLALLLPADFANYFTDLAEVVNNVPSWPPTDPAALAALGALEQKYGIHHA